MCKVENIMLNALTNTPTTFRAGVHGQRSVCLPEVSGSFEVYLVSDVDPRVCLFLQRLRIQHFLGCLLCAHYDARTRHTQLLIPAFLLHFPPSKLGLQLLNL